MATPDWQEWRYLLGEWVGEGGGEPGEGTGGASFSLDLDERVLTRKSWLAFPARGDQPAFTHEDLLVTYQEFEGVLRALYLDNEGHVIHYSVTVSPQGDIVHVSDALPNAPRFRLSYLKDGEGESFKIRFEIAPPGKPEEFTVHVESRSNRKR